MLCTLLCAFFINICMKLICGDFDRIEYLFVTCYTEFLYVPVNVNAIKDLKGKGHIKSTTINEVTRDTNLGESRTYIGNLNDEEKW